MQPGDTFAYKGDAARLTDGEPVEIEGTFAAIEQRSHDGETRWLVEDTRREELAAAAAPDERPGPDTHRYLLPAGFAGPQATG